MSESNDRAAAFLIAYLRRMQQDGEGFLAQMQAGPVDLTVLRKVARWLASVEWLSRAWKTRQEAADAAE